MLGLMVYWFKSEPYLTLSQPSTVSVLQLVEDLAELKTLARIDTLVTVVDATTLLMDLQGLQLLKVRWLGSVGAVGAVGAFEALSSLLLQDAMSECGQAPGEDCVDDRLVAGVLVDLVRPARPVDGAAGWGRWAGPQPVCRLGSPQLPRKVPFQRGFVNVP